MRSIHLPGFFTAAVLPLILAAATLGCEPKATEPKATTVTIPASANAPPPSSGAPAPAPKADGARAARYESCEPAQMRGWSPTAEEVASALGQLDGICFNKWGARDESGVAPTAAAVREAVAQCSASQRATAIQLVIPLDRTNSAYPPACAVHINAVAWGARRFIAVEQDVPGRVPFVWVTHTFEIRNGAAVPYFRGTPSDCVVKGHGDSWRSMFGPLGTRALLSPAFQEDLRAGPPWEVARIVCGYPPKD